MKFSTPFPNGHNLSMEKDIVIPREGKPTIRVKGLNEQDILEIRDILLKEIKRQIKEENGLEDGTL